MPAAGPRAFRAGKEIAAMIIEMLIFFFFFRAQKLGKEQTLQPLPCLFALDSNTVLFEEASLPSRDLENPVQWNSAVNLGFFDVNPPWQEL